MKKHYDAVIVGGGAAGFFAAIQLKQRQPHLDVLILEKTNKVLSKVLVSGGGRCNVTHACFDPTELVEYYPRGNKELRSVFHRFQPADMIAWLSENNVQTKVEEDGRMFPESNTSSTIINLFLELTQQLSIDVELKQELVSISGEPGEELLLHLVNGNVAASNVIFCNGGGAGALSPLKKLGLNLEKPVPSLFTFKIKHPILSDLMGVSVPHAETEIVDSNFAEFGPLLITHWGLSGPAVLKLSAWGARYLSDRNYQFQVKVNWLGNDSTEDVLHSLSEAKIHQAKKQIVNFIPVDIPKRLWVSVVAFLKLSNKRWADISKQEIQSLLEQLTEAVFQVNGKTTFKEEFVTCGGVSLKEVNFKTMESKKFPGIYFAGEVLDIDALTGGFNFQAAWSTAYIAAESIAAKFE